MRIAWRGVLRVTVAVATLSAGLLLPIAPAQAVVTIPIRTAELRVSNPVPTTVVALPFTAHHVALHWAGDRDADVDIAFRTGTGAFRQSYHAGAGDAGADPTRTYGAVVSAADATAVRITADRTLRDLRLVAFTDGAARVTYRAARATAQAADQPDIISRAEWGADESLRSGTPSYATIQKLVVHHTATGEAADPKSTVRSIYTYHTQTQGWNDIGYNFLIDSSGRVYEGRWARTYLPGEEPTGENTANQGVVGAHASGYNTGSMGVSMIGNFTSTTPTTAARAGLADLLAWKAERHGIDPMATSTFNSVSLPNIFGHRDVGATACPGDAFYPQLPVLRQEVATRLTGSEFTAVTPARLVDTRSSVPLGPGETLRVQVSGAGGVPPTGATAAALNVTAVAPSAAGYLTVFPAGQVRPNASSLNFVPGLTVPNHVVAKLSADGAVSVYNSGGTTHVLVDVFGWYAEAGGAVPGSVFVPMAQPVRFLDTRQTGAVGPAGTVNVPIRDQHGVPSDATAVVANVTVTGPTRASHITVFPAGEPQPNVSTLNVVAGQTVPNLAVVKIGASGAVTAYNHSGDAHVIVDVLGWFAPATGTLLHPAVPSRVLDSRYRRGLVGPLAGGTAHRLDVTNVPFGVPNSARTVVLTVTVTAPSAPGYLTVWPTGTAVPQASNLNFTAGQTVANLVVTRLGTDGAIQLYASSGATQVIADVVGWYADS